MRMPVILKLADVEDRIGYFDPRLEAMREAATKEDFISGKPNPNYKPLDIGAYRKILLANINDYQAKEEEEYTADYNQQLGRHQRGEKETRGDILASAAAAGTVLGLTGGIYGAAAGGLAGNVLKVFPKFRGVGAGTKGAAIGAALGGIGMGSLGFWGMKPFRKRQPVAHPGELSDYLNDYRDYEAEEVRKAFSKPITGKDKLDETVRYWAMDGGIPEDGIIYEKTAAPIVYMKSAGYLTYDEGTNDIMAHENLGDGAFATHKYEPKEKDRTAVNELLSGRQDSALREAKQGGRRAYRKGAIRGGAIGGVAGLLGSVAAYNILGKGRLGRSSTNYFLPPFVGFGLTLGAATGGDLHKKKYNLDAKSKDIKHRIPANYDQYASRYHHDLIVGSDIGAPKKYLPKELSDYTVLDDIGDGHYYKVRSNIDGKVYNIDNERYWDTRDPGNIRIEPSAFDNFKDEFADIDAKLSTKTAAPIVYMKSAGYRDIKRLRKKGLHKPKPYMHGTTTPQTQNSGQGSSN